MMRVVNEVCAGVVTKEVCVLFVDIVTVVIKRGVGLTAVRLQAELRMLVANICKGPGVGGAVDACRSCNAGGASLLFWCMIVWTVRVFDVSAVEVVVAVVVVVTSI